MSDKTIDFLISYETVNKDNMTWGNFENKFSFMKNIFTDILIALGDESYDSNIIINLWMLLNIYNIVYKQEKNRDKENYYEIFDKQVISMTTGRNNIEYYFELISKVVDIQKIDLKGINLRGKVFQNVTFNKCHFGEAMLSGAILRNVKFIDCKLQATDLKGATLENVVFRKCNIDGGKLRGIEVNMGEFVQCSMKQCQLQGAKIFKTIFNDTDIENAYLDSAEFIQAEILDIDKKSVNAFENANIENLKWSDDLHKLEFYRKVKRK